ncbi:protein kinase domain-containing protein, partial [Serinicoccus sediminis]|uniref:protein kinase domain-containing protein n=1 Tax=Serinicoccus sediminis TaxID=2306021 RepID=UPI00101F1D68
MSEDPTEATARPDGSPAPDRVLGGRYELGDLIGRGGMADVHVGHDLRLGRPVAIKVLRTDLARDSSFLARFRREAQSAAGLSHPSIVGVFDSGEEAVTESGGATVQVPYIVMELVEGRTLRELLNERRTLDPDEAARITAAVLAALEYAHERGLVHRDIKPANVMVTDGGAVKVMDFGIARAIADTAATMTQTQAVMGTARYLSPEQAQGLDVDGRSDLYSVGCLLYELLTGRTPFQGDPVSLVYQHLGEPPKAPSTHAARLPEALDAITLHALEKKPEERYQDAAAFRADLNAARADEPVSAAARSTYDRAIGAGVAGAGAAAAAAAARWSASRAAAVGRAGRGGPSGGSVTGSRRSARMRSTWCCSRCTRSETSSSALREVWPATSPSSSSTR